MLKYVILTALAFLIAPVKSQVVITEVMFDPLGSEFTDEFIEIYNLSQTDVIYLHRWVISDGTGVDSLVAVGDDLRLGPQQYAVILDPSYLAGPGVYDNLIPQEALRLTIDNNTLGSGGLSNTTPETVSLISSSGEAVSIYTYSTGNSPGFSDEKIDPAGPNDALNWADSQRQHGTPGGRNSVSPFEFDLAISSADISFDPQVGEAGQSIEIVAVIHNQGTRSVNEFAVQFFADMDHDSTINISENISEPVVIAQETSAGDSVSVSTTYQNVMPGFNLIAVEIDFSADQKPTNNQAVRSLLVGFPDNALRINEMMFSPLTDFSEWIEVYNPGPEAVNMNHWGISDSDPENRVLVTGDLVLASDSYLVFTAGPDIHDIFSPPAGTVVALPDLPALNNDSDSVVLTDLTGRMIDRVDYNSDWGGDRGVSLEKINPLFPSNDSTNWSSSVAFAGGTPGERNSIYATASLPATSSLSIAPNPFSPDGDGVDDFAVIGYSLPVTTALVNAKIYDIRGRLIRYLANSRPSGSQDALVWDGNDDQGQRARVGIYIVFLQALNAQAGVITSNRKTVVLAARL